MCRAVSVLKASALALLLAACGGDAPPAGDQAAPGADPAAPPPAPVPDASDPSQAHPTARVRIVAPGDGHVIEGPSVTVRMEVEGFDLVPAGENVANSGHHHLFLNDDVSPAGVPIPTIPGRVVHIGDATQSYTFEDVPPGDHRLIAVVGDWLHIPLIPWVVDTVFFTVQ